MPFQSSYQLESENPLREEIARVSVSTFHNGQRMLLSSATAASLSTSVLDLTGYHSAGHFSAGSAELLGECIDSCQAPWIAGKRLFDIIFSVIALCFLIPIFVLCALAIKIESEGPILFLQRRIGRGGVPFHIVKFRTMVPNAEAVLADFLENNPEAQAEWNADRKLRRDPRVTRIGSTMRKLSLDEVPQFWNVLKGDMSVVGPRPIVQSEVPMYGGAFSAYCAVRPGVTGLWQVSGRNDTGYEQRVALDCRYVESCSPNLDLRIILQTFPAVTRSAGAY